MLFTNEAEFEAACRSVTERISRLMCEKGACASTAESLTGGMLASQIVNVPGVSAWFTEGCVTYTDRAKENRLLVPRPLLEAHTAVSREAARAMAEGSRASSGSDIAVSTTGVAGPGPDELGREAGLVFIGGANANGAVTRELHLEGSRTDIRRSAAYEALKLMLSLVETL